MNAKETFERNLQTVVNDLEGLAQSCDRGGLDEAQEILDRFDRQNNAHTMTVGEWKKTFAEESQATEDQDERAAIEAAAALLDGEDPEALAVCYVATDPVDFVILPYGATTAAEKQLCRNLSL